MTDSQKMQRAFAHFENPAKPYWYWRCGGCGFDDNRNYNRQCIKCGEQITCETAGGHHFPTGRDCQDCGRPISDSEEVRTP